MTKVLFLINNLTGGGAERVLVNLVNRMDAKRYDITVMTIFDLGEYRTALAEHIHYRSIFKKRIRGFRFWMKLLGDGGAFRMMKVSPGEFDVMIAYLQGASTRMVAGCPDPSVAKLAWIHSDISKGSMVKYYRSDGDIANCYRKFGAIVAVSPQIQQEFVRRFGMKKRVHFCYNTNDTESILKLSRHTVEDARLKEEGFKVFSAGRLDPLKGFDRLLRIHAKLLSEGFPHRLLILGEGKEREKLSGMIETLGLQNSAFLLGFQKNPYAVMAQCDLFVCSSHHEGLSTVLSEATILGIPSLSTRCSGAEEVLGSHNEYGMVVDNDEEALLNGLRAFLSDKTLTEHYRQKAKERASLFTAEDTVSRVEELIDRTLREKRENGI